MGNIPVEKYLLVKLTLLRNRSKVLQLMRWAENYEDKGFTVFQKPLYLYRRVHSLSANTYSLEDMFDAFVKTLQEAYEGKPLNLKKEMDEAPSNGFMIYLIALWILMTSTFMPILLKGSFAFLLELRRYEFHS